jgi:ABC-2 type transport system permease protein
LTPKLLRDTWLVFERALGQTLRTPVLVVVTLGQPLVFLFLFGPLLKNSLRGVDPNQVFNLYIPGLMVQLALFGSLFAGFALTAELRRGVIERFQVTPISRFSLLLGRALRDTVILVVQGALIVLPAIPLGLHVRPVELIIMLGVMALLALAFAPLSYALALILKRDEVLGPLINLLTVPLLLLSGILIPMSYAPGWLQGVSRVNPLTHVVDGSRQLFNGHLWNGSVATAVLLSAGMAAFALILVGRLFVRTTE